MVASAADILDLVHESVIICDAEGAVLSWNKGAEALYGWTSAEALGRNIDDLLATAHDDLPQLVEQACAEGIWEGELLRSTRSGEVRVVDVRWTVTRDTPEAPLRIIETARDVTQRKAAEDALRLSEFRYRSMFETMAVAFWEVDFAEVGAMLIPLRDAGVTDLRSYLLANRTFVRATMERALVVDLNASGLKLFGAPNREAIIGRPIADFWPPASEPVYIDSLVATMTRAPHVVTETRLQRLDGGLVDVLFTVSLSQDNRKRGVVLIGVIDISARKQAEAALQTMQAEFAHAARVSMLGELTASIAHEVNQPLAAIAASAAASLRWLAARDPDLDEVRSLADRMAADARRASDIIGRVRAMAERRDPERLPLSLNDLVEEAARFLQYEFQAHSIAVDLRLAADLPLVPIDRTQMQQVIVNLAVNAVQAMASSADRNLVIATAATQGGELVLEVQDSGHGLVGDGSRLFESFYSTKAEGMGMGLAICRSIVESHAGTIVAIDTKPGARFIVTLPLGPLAD